ncbi:MAG: alanine--tRNA ligase [Wolbachia endosymbiont of Fragariocoptes setiger]|nr:alanine--tRNA ligase [Wolbachia endosymbiont of Fragariocoptes setiger]
MQLNEIREKFVKFFSSLSHKHISSSSLIPEHDSTLMFTNAGMVQFKNIFTGIEKTDMKRAVSSQKCLRVGGKHNDLETVGYTSRHHTFFEMLGNFSFGDYFKETAIEYAWNFLTKELLIDKKRLSITVYHTDDESYEIWRKISGFSDDKIIKITTDDNFWSMGNTGPCGPCSEIFYDHKNSSLNDNDRIVEIWNLVFMEFNKDEEGNLYKLPQKCIDTGMGLERITAVMQNVYDNYDTDFFSALIDKSQEYCGDQKNRVAHKIIADHIRAAAFLIADGVLPGNEGRNYVLRRLIRRATRYTQQLNYQDSLLHKVFLTLVDGTSAAYMGDTYLELVRAKNMIESTLKSEEENFRDTLMRGINLLDKFTANLNSGETLSGELAFKLYDTYGFPLDITLDILREKKINFDKKGFDDAMNTQKARSKWVGSGEKLVDQIWFHLIDKFGKTEFVGYECYEVCDAKVLAIISSKNEVVNSAKEGEKVTILLDKTPFYGESGGQLGDIGNLLHEGIVIVENTNKIHGLHLHRCLISSGSISQGDKVTAVIDHIRRNNLSKNHSSTHILHLMLRKVLGDHITQKGSLVSPHKIRFDFNHNTQVTEEQLFLIEDMVNGFIRANHSTSTKIQDTSQAINEGATALFGEKYGDQVRVVSIEDSKELCGGTHVQYTGEIGLFRIITEGSVAFGVRRIEALTGQDAIDHIRKNDNQLKEIGAFLKVSVSDISVRLNRLNQEHKEYEIKIKNLYRQLINGKNITNTKIGELNFLSHSFTDMPIAIIREFALQPKTVAAFISSEQRKTVLIVKVSKDLTDKINAMELIFSAINKKCGGNAELAQVGCDSGIATTNIYNELKKLC